MGKEEQVRGIVQSTLQKLAKLGIDYRELEDVLVTDLSVFPDTILAGNPQDFLTGILFNYLGNREYLTSKGVDSQALNKFYTFDMEVFDVSRMYTDFLHNVMAISHRELVFSDIVEDFSAVDLDSGTGTLMVQFVYQEKSYHYPAKFYGEWFDPEIVPFVNQVLEEHNNEKKLYGVSDGYQALSLFYATEEWATEFNQAFGPGVTLTK